MNIRIKTYLFLFSFFILASCVHTFDGKDGLKTVYFPNSDLVCQKIEYKDSLKNGLFEEYYRNGNLKIRQHYIKDKQDDSSLVYNENGTIAVIQYFKNFNREGCWKKFNKDGKMYEEQHYKNDYLDGVSAEYTYKTGKLLKREYYTISEKDGKQEYYYSNGKPKCIAYFDHNNPCMGTEEWYDNGEKVNNDFKITVEEQNKVLLEGKLRFFIRLENPQEDDMVFLTGDKDTGNIVTPVSTLPHIKDYYLLEFQLARGGFLMEKVRLAAFRKTAMGNDMIKTTTFNATANNF